MLLSGGHSSPSPLTRRALRRLCQLRTSSCSAALVVGDWLRGDCWLCTAAACIHSYNMVSKREYVTCKCPTCPAYPGTSMRSWRPIHKLLQGTQYCTFCDTPFRLPASYLSSFSAEAKGGASAGKGKGKGGKRKGGKRVSFEEQGGGAADAGWDHAGDWYVQDSKGRSKPTFQIDADDCLKELAEAKLLENVQDEQERIRIRTLLFPVKPEKPKTEGDILKEALTRIEKANAQSIHAAKQLEDMEKSYRDRCEALMEYKGRVDTQKAVLTAAQEELQVAQKALDDLKPPSDPKPPPKPPPALRTLVQQMRTFNSAEKVGQVLSEIQGLPPIQAEAGIAIHSAVSDLVQKQLKEISDAIAAAFPEEVSANAYAVGAGGVPSVSNIADDQKADGKDIDDALMREDLKREAEETDNQRKGKLVKMASVDVCKLAEEEAAKIKNLAVQDAGISSTGGGQPG